jgi:hypothetical protein
MSDAFAVLAYDPYRRADTLPCRPRVAKTPKPSKPPKLPKEPKLSKWAKGRKSERPTKVAITSETLVEVDRLTLVDGEGMRAWSIMSETSSHPDTFVDVADLDTHPNDDADVREDDIAYAPSWPLHEGAVWPPEASSVVFVAHTVKTGKLPGKRAAKDPEWDEVNVDDALPQLRDLRLLAASVPQAKPEN